MGTSRSLRMGGMKDTSTGEQGCGFENLGERGLLASSTSTFRHRPLKTVFQHRVARERPPLELPGLLENKLRKVRAVRKNGS